MMKRPLRSLGNVKEPYLVASDLANAEQQTFEGREVNPNGDTIEERCRLDLAATHRILALEGLNEGTWAHLSCRSSPSGRYLVSPGDTHFSMITRSSLLLYDAKGRLVCGNGPANHDAIPIHLSVYEARPDISCILHFHSPYASSLCLLETGRFNTRASQTAAYFHGKVSYLDTYSIPRTNCEDGKGMARALGDRKVLFMKNHGVLVASASLDDAVVSAYQLERACQLQVLAASSGEPLQDMDEEFATRLASEHCNGEPGYFDGMKRLLDKTQPDYAN